ITCYFNGPRPTTVNQPANVATWYHPAPYGIYATLDGHLAISFSSLEKLGTLLDVPEIASFSTEEVFSRREEIAALIATALKKRKSADWLKVLADPDIWYAPLNNSEPLQ